MVLQVVHGLPELVGAAEERDDLAHGWPCAEMAAPGARPAGRTARRRARRISPAAPRESAAPRGRTARRSPCARLRRRCARSRRVRSGALKARWQSRSNGSASGCSAARPVRRSLIPALGKALDDLARAASGSAQRSRSSGAVGQSVRTLLGRVVGVADDAELLAVGVELVDQMGRDLDLAAVEVELPPLARSAAR